MKKIIVAILMLAVFCTACGTDKDESGFSATSYVTSPTGIVKETVKETAKETAKETVKETESAKEIIADSNFDVNACQDAPILSGASREPNWSMIFDENCVVIGDNSYPAYIKVSDLGSDIQLETVSIGRKSSDNPREINDYYVLYYHGYSACGVITSRTADVRPEDAYICTWTMNDVREVPVEKMGIMGLSACQSTSDVMKVYVPDEADDRAANYYGVTEADGERFSCILKHNPDFATMLTIIPEKITPGAYDYYVTK